uniref:PRELI/MSF1 domain-containing protein n=1 Tax=Panagrellus redivivus TaxID=6233 RepID=A0A7E4ZTW1_PANRE
MCRPLNVISLDPRTLNLPSVFPKLTLYTLSPENFGTIAKYAWDFDKTNLKSKCFKYYRVNVGKILTSEFVGLDSST